ncbi:MAG: hypothetical protein ACJ77K_02005 [Bacteroidia bacterium]
MKKNRVAIVLVILLGSLSFWYINHNHNGTLANEMKDFAVQDTASITKIFLVDKNARAVTLERVPGSPKWTVDGQYGARMDAIQTLLETIRRIDVKEPVGKRALSNVIKGIASKAIKCEIYQNGKLSKAYYVGTETADYTGTYMVMIDPETMEAMEKPFVTYIPGFEGYLTTRYFTEEKGWRDRSMFMYNPNDIRKVRMEIPTHPEFGYEVTVKGNNDYEIRMIGDGKLVTGVDPMAVKQYLSYFQSLSFESFEVDLKPSQIDSVERSTPINILSVTDKDGKVNKVKFFARKPKNQLYDSKGVEIKYDQERMNALLNNGKDFVLTQFYMFGKVMPTVDYFQQGKAAKPKMATQPNS